MRVARARWFTVVLATMAWSIAGSGGALAQETPIPFRPACDILTPSAVTVVLGVPVTPDATMPDAYCLYLAGGQEVASVRLSASPPLVLAALGLRGATDTIVGGVPALTSVRGDLESSAVVIVGSQDGGTLEIQVDRASGADSPLATARALTEAILATGPVTARASLSTAEPIVPAGSACQLITRAELKRLTGQSFAEGELDVNDRCVFGSKDHDTDVSLTIAAGDLASLRFTESRELVVGSREALDNPVLAFLLVDLGAGQQLGVQITSKGEGIKAEDLPSLRVAIAETAISRMAPGDITCPLIATDALLGASALDLQPLARTTPRWCWFVTPDQRTGLILRVVAHRDVDYVRGGLRSGLPDLTPPTDLEVAGHHAAGATGASGTMLSVRLDKVPGEGRDVLFAVLVGENPTTTDPLTMLASVAEAVLAAR